MVTVLSLTLACPPVFAISDPKSPDQNNEPAAVLPDGSLGKEIGLDKKSQEEVEQKDLFASIQQIDLDVEGTLQRRTVDYLRGKFSSDDFSSFINILEQLQPSLEKALKENPNASFKIRYVDTDERQIEKEIPYTQIQRILRWANNSDVQIYNPDESTKSLLRTLSFGVFDKTTRTDVHFAIARFLLNGTLATLSITLSHHPIQVALVEGIFLGAASAGFAIFRQHFSDYVSRARTKAGELFRWGIFELPFVASLLTIDAYYGIYPTDIKAASAGLFMTVILSIFSQGNGDTIIINRAEKQIAEGKKEDDKLKIKRLAAEEHRIFTMTDKQFNKTINKAETSAVKSQQRWMVANSVTSVMLAALKTAAENAHAYTILQLSWIAYGVYGGLGWVYIAYNRLKNGARIRDLFDIRGLFEPKQQKETPTSPAILSCHSLFA